MTIKKEIQPFLIEIVEEAGQIAMSYFRTGVNVDSKRADGRVVDSSDPLTVADVKIQEFLIDKISENYSQSNIIAEELEQNRSISDSGLTWIIDPIDGTYNFTRGIRYVTVSVAALLDGQPIVSVNHLPALRDTYVATGDNVCLNGEPVSVSSHEDPESCVVAPSVPPSHGQRKSYSEGIRSMVERFGNVRWFGTTQGKLSLIADGSIDGTATIVSPPVWDTVAGVHMIRNAGGKVTDIHGNDWSVGSEGIVASNGLVHDKLLAIGTTMD